MDELAKFLAQLRPRKPSEAFDRRMGRLFEECRPVRRWRLLGAPVPLWSTILACAGCLVVGIYCPAREEGPVIPAEHMPVVVTAPVPRTTGPNPFDLTQNTGTPAFNGQRYLITILSRPASADTGSDST